MTTAWRARAGGLAVRGVQSLTPRPPLRHGEGETTKKSSPLSVSERGAGGVRLPELPVLNLV
jgi:hypothetical protein